MTTQTFHFAVKPGHEPVQLPSLSAHDTLPWVAQGYEVFYVSTVEHPKHGVLPHIESSCLLSSHDWHNLYAAALDCVAKSVANPGTEANALDRAIG